MNDRYLNLTLEENLTNYVNAPNKNDLLNSLNRFEEEFMIKYGDKIDLSKLSE